jgi:PTS system N-acetylglucosamine-specific IIC component
VRLGFSFSAGLFDYVLNFSRATRPLWLLPVGVGYFLLYYTLFRFVIVRFDLKTPGRDRTQTAAPVSASAGVPAQRANEWLAALGGADNLQSVDACTTRLRLTVGSQAAVDVAALTRLGSRGLVRPSANALQVVVGTMADQLAGEIREAQRSAQQPVAVTIGNNMPDSGALVAALGGRANVLTAQALAGRVRIGVADTARVNSEALMGLGLRGVAVPAPGCVHLLTGIAMSTTVAASLAPAVS